MVPIIFLLDNIGFSVSNSNSLCCVLISEEDVFTSLSSLDASKAMFSYALLPIPKEATA